MTRTHPPLERNALTANDAAKPIFINSSIRFDSDRFLQLAVLFSQRFPYLVSAAVLLGTMTAPNADLSLRQLNLKVK